MHKDRSVLAVRASGSSGSASGSNLDARAVDRRAGITLLGTSVVISLVTLLAALLLPASSGIRKSAHRLRCANNLQLGLANQAYLATLGVFPPSSGLPNLNPYLAK